MFDFNLEFARGGANFTVDLFEQIFAATGKENIVFSPFSVQSCVALAFAGADGETADEIATALKFASNASFEVAETFQFVFEKYKDSDLLKIANKAYVLEGKQLKSEYEKTLKESYYAEAEAVNFAESDAAAENINSWVSEKTAGKITELIGADSLNENTRLVLLNALHFKGNWAHKFDESQTEEDNFWVGDDESVKTQFMNQKAKFGYGYFEDLGCTALDMPYDNSDLSMLVLLPNERSGLKALAEKLKEINLVDLASQFATEEVFVKLPKFKIDFSIEMSDVLKKLGLNKMFSDSAEFGNMLESPEDVAVSKVFHKACIEVNEEGTEAAAATGMIMMTRMMLMPIAFTADHPFLYMVWNKRNILFAGAYFNPTA